MTYVFLQQYWWFVVSLLGALLVFLLFVQGGNSLIFCLGKTEEHRKMMINSLSLIHISEPTRQAEISYAVFCLKKKKKKRRTTDYCSSAR